MRYLFTGMTIVFLLSAGARAQLTLPPMPSLPSIKVNINPTDQGDPNGEEQVRDPFWPVGYKPVATVAAEEATAKADEEEKKKVALDMNKLSAEEQAAVKAKMRTGGFMTQGNVRFAIINNQIVAPGEVFKLKYQGKTHEFRVRGIKGSTIVLEPKWNTGI